jgi:NACalpha-BTF3-like transcription factor
MAEFEVTKPQAEKALLESGGDLIRALEALVTPPNFPQDNTDAAS